MVGGTVLPMGWVLAVIGEIAAALVAWRIYVLWKGSQPPAGGR
jgi:hypothetical protein